MSNVKVKRKSPQPPLTKTFWGREAGAIYKRRNGVKKVRTPQ
jgi:hypothetical protein